MIMAHSPSSELLIEPITGHIGAEVRGLDLAEQLEDAEVLALRQALLRWKVLFFMAQHLSHGEQIVFARRFGEVTPAHPLEGEAVNQHPQVLPIAGSDAIRWQGDGTAAVNPPAASVLRAVDVPEQGGVSSWTNLVAAYQGLPAQLRALADGLRAEHRAEPQDDGAAALASIHPVVRVHPETGERALFVSPAFTTRLVDVSVTESQRLLGLFFEQLSRPANTVRFQWNQGDLAFWDNRAAAHLGPQVSAARGDQLLYRVALRGEIPVGVHGFRSQPLEGRPYGGRSDAPTTSWLRA
jgi:alpha-ketoglutarate-dependent taurine dioxygenase